MRSRTSHHKAFRSDEASDRIRKQDPHRRKITSGIIFSRFLKRLVSLPEKISIGNKDKSVDWKLIPHHRLISHKRRLYGHEIISEDRDQDDPKENPGPFVFYIIILSAKYDDEA